MTEFDIGCKVEAVNVRLQIVDVLGKGDVIWGIKWESMIRKCCELLGANELCIVIGAVFEGAANVLLPK